MSLHKGEMVEKVVRENRFPITLLAKRLGKSRQYVYNLFENPDVSIEIIFKIGKIIHYDFNNDLKEIAKIPEEYKIKALTEPDITFENVTYWKAKYFELLEQYKFLLENKIEDFVKRKS
ncbi:MAG: hypothetical protein KDD29_02445 [Flavobacteriales bacterium]|nr:hypothetical protein [Flavobacteriales bacterium]MCB9336122.1 hypothetical protein [Flavobacteriales bacterium]